MKNIVQVDLLLKNARVYNSYYKKFREAHVAILDGRVFYVDTKKELEYEAKQVVECHEQYLIPGMIDIHMHIESTMTTPGPFCEQLAQNGVTTIISEPHEIANVKGIAGVEAMIEAGKDCDIDIFYGIPSSVPSTDATLETTGATIGYDEMVKLSEQDDVICVGEVMNYSQIIQDDTLEICKFLEYLRKHKPRYVIEGHCPRLVDLDLAKFLYLGINGDHTEHTIEEVAQRFEQGMFVEIQYKMLDKELIEYIKEHNLYEHFALVTDDVMADDFVYRGHLNVLVQRAIEQGLRPEDAIYAATFTPARRMNLTDRGSIAPGKLADFALVADLENFKIAATYKDGKCIFDGEKVPAKKVTYRFPEDFYKSVTVETLTLQHFEVHVETEAECVTCRVIEVNDGGTTTKEVLRQIKVKDGRLLWEESDCLLATVFERYGKNGGIGVGLVTGDCLKRGAVATTYAHDHHNLLVIGKHPIDMYLAGQRVIELQGGIVVVEDGRLQGEAQLNIGGILSEEPVELLAKKIKTLKEALVRQGYKHYNPIMSLCTISLPVSPELKLSDRGIISVKEGKCVPLVVE